MNLLLSLFAGRRDVYAEQASDGAYFPVTDSIGAGAHFTPLFPSDVADHVNGCRTIGVYVVVENMVRLICWDVDHPDKDEARTRARAIKRVLVAEQGIPERALSLEFSGRKGYHVWLHLAEWVPVQDALEYGRWVADRIGAPETEVFPKGAVREGGLGNLVKLPLALHRVSRKRSVFVDSNWSPTDAETHLGTRRPLPAPIFAECVRRMRASRPPAPSLRRERPRAARQDDLLPCAEHIRDYGEGEGARNHALFALGLACKRAGMSENDALGAVEQAAARCRPAVPMREVEKATRSAYSIPGDGFDCRNPVLHSGAQPHCLRACPRYLPSFGAAR